MIDEKKTMALKIGMECAREAWEQRTLDVDGKIYINTCPMQGDWDYLDFKMPAASEKDKDAFYAAYTKEIEDMLRRNG